MLKKIFSLFFLALAINPAKAAEEAAAMDRNSSEFWDKIVFPLRDFICTLNGEVRFWTEVDRKSVCAHLDPNAMVPILEKTCDIGKRFIKENKIEEIKKILITLLIPNQVFNTEGHYEGYICHKEKYVLKCSSFWEFSICVEKSSRPLFMQLRSEFQTANKDHPDLIKELETYLKQIDPSISA